MIDLGNLAAAQIDPEQRAAAGRFIERQAVLAGNLEQRPGWAGLARKPGANRLHAGARQIPGQDAVSPSDQAPAIERGAGDALLSKIANLVPCEVEILRESVRPGQSEKREASGERHRDNAILRQNEGTLRFSGRARKRPESG